MKYLTEGVMQALSSARQSEVQAWEEESTACEHTLMLEQYATGPIKAEGASRLIAFGTGHGTELYHSRQVWPIARNATSRRTSGCASHAVRLGAGERSLAA